MLKLDEDALLCDLAETYRIYDLNEQPLSKVAVFACGLRDDSRIKLKMSGQKVPLDSLLRAGMLDRLTTLVYFQTEDGQNGRNRPPAILETLLLDKQTFEKVSGFASGKDFENARKKIIEKIGGG